MRGVAYQGDWFCGADGLFGHGHYGGILHLIFWGVLLFTLYKIISHLVLVSRDSISSPSRGRESLAILEKRYAAGEIDQAEFIQKKKDLGG